MVSVPHKLSGKRGTRHPAHNAQAGKPGSLTIEFL
jgi:hypothetical protein